MGHWTDYEIPRVLCLSVTSPVVAILNHCRSLEPRK